MFLLNENQLSLSFDVELVEKIGELLLHLVLIQDAFMQSTQSKLLLGLVQNNARHFALDQLVLLVALLQKQLHLLIVHLFVHLFVQGLGELHLVGPLVLLDVGLVVVWVEGLVDQKFRLVLGVGDFEEVVEDLLDCHFDITGLDHLIREVDSPKGLEVIHMVVVLIFDFEQIPNSSSDHLHYSNRCFYHHVALRLADVIWRNAQDEISPQNEAGEDGYIVEGFG